MPPWRLTLPHSILLVTGLSLLLPPLTHADWRPTPTRAAPLVATPTPSGGLALSARLTIWDGWFWDEYRLAAGET